MKHKKNASSLCECTVCASPYDPNHDANDYLLCKRIFTTLGPPGVIDGNSFPDEKKWWLRFEPHATNWICEAVHAGEIISPLEAWHGAEILIAEGYMTFGGTSEWTDFTGHELLFECLGHGGIMEGWSTRAIVLGMRSFMGYLVTHGVVKRSVGNHIIAEIRAWEPRIVAYFEEGGPWCRADPVTHQA